MYPRRIETTSNGNTFIADWRSTDSRGKVVMIKQCGDIRYCNGNSNKNSDEKSFHPVSVLVTPNDHVIIRNINTAYIIILTSGGDSVAYCNLTKIGVMRPYSMALSSKGTIYIGSVSGVKV